MTAKILSFAATAARRVLGHQFRKGDPLLNDRYVSAAPFPQQTVDLFKGAWASRLPLPNVESGKVGLFEDERIAWLIERAGGSVSAMRILELGPLEGGHTTMLERAGAGSIHAIDANSLAYLKCLLVKELLGLEKAHFELGDFDAYLEQCRDRYDMVVASGVLYHLIDPVRTLENMARIADRIFIWSHFFDEQAMPPGDPRRAWLTGEVREQDVDGQTLRCHVRSYGANKHSTSFCGGTLSKSVWLEQGQVIEFFRRRGYVVSTAFETPDHPHGPAACIFAERAS